jgi:hypothetical protein
MGEHPRGERRLPGRWVAEEPWPSPRIREATWFLAPGALVESPGVPSRSIALDRAYQLQLNWGAWCPFGPDDLPVDVEEAGSYGPRFETAPLRERLEVLGEPVLELRVIPGGAGGQLAARLEDVAPDGSAWRFSYGILDLRHRGGSEAPSALVPGVPVNARVPMLLAAHVLAPGHRLRLGLSTSCWPLAWPAAASGKLRLDPAASRLGLPVRPLRPEECQAPPDPPHGPDGATETLREHAPRRCVARDDHTGAVVLEVRSEGAARDRLALERHEDLDLETGDLLLERFSAVPGNPDSTRHEVEVESLVQRGAWSARVRTRAELRIAGGAFELETRVQAFESERRFAERCWHARVPRGV